MKTNIHTNVCSERVLDFVTPGGTLGISGWGCAVA